MHRNPNLTEELQDALTAAGLPAAGMNSVVSRELASRLEGIHLEPAPLLRVIYVMACDMQALARSLRGAP